MAISEPRLEDVGDEMKETAPSLIKQLWKFMQNQRERAEKKGLIVGTFVLREQQDHQQFLEGSCRRIFENEEIVLDLGIFESSLGEKI